MLNRRSRVLAVTALTAITTLGFAAAPALAATSTYTDATNDVVVYDKSVKNPYVKAVDISTLSVNVTRDTVRVTIHVADLRPTTTKYGQNFDATVVPTDSTDGGVVTSSTGVIFHARVKDTITDKACTITKMSSGKSTDITSQGKCLRNTTKNTITFVAPTSAVGPRAKYVLANGTALATTKAKAGYYSVTAGDTSLGYVTKVG